jgi:perosamine synthetase
MDLASRHRLTIIEDAAHAIGATYRGRQVGSIADLTTFSLHPVKQMTTGEGGMVVTDDDRIAERARSLRNLCFRTDRRFLHTELGHQFRLTNMQAAVGVGQVRRIGKIVERKRWLAAEYTRRLEDLRGRVQLPMERSWARSVFWVYGLVLGDDVPFEAVEFATRLKRLGVETRPFFLGMHEQPVFHDRNLFQGDRHPVAERLARRGLYVPSGLALTVEQVERVSAAVHEILA